MVALSRAVSRKHAMEMLLTGDLYSAEHAERIGLIHRVVAAAELDEAVRELCAKITSKSRHTIATGKATFYRQLELGYEEAYDCTGQIMVENMLSREAEEGIGAFLEKRDPAHVLTGDGPQAAGSETFAAYVFIHHNTEN